MSYFHLYFNDMHSNSEVNEYQSMLKMVKVRNVTQQSNKMRYDFSFQYFTMIKNMFCFFRLQL
jgi:hypothetical protein